MVELAPKVSKATFQSIVDPIEDLDSVKEVSNMIKRHGRKLISTYLPFAHTIPLKQGLVWEPTWKSTPISDRYVSQYAVISDECKKYIQFQNLFVN